jgi:N-acetylmuramoyl-L-alanine amidase
MKLKLAIDPGHGMGNRSPGRFDPGAVSSGELESAIALDWALTGKHILHQAGIDCFLIRDDQTDPTPIGTRDDKAELAGCTHFISLHCNAGGGTGVETFYRDAQDKAFASEIQSAALQATGGANRGIKHESATRHGKLAVFGFDGPACLLELGFIDNKVDRKWLKSKEARIKFWQLCVGILRNQE